MSEEHAHIVPYKTFLVIWVCLLILTGATIAVAQYQPRAIEHLGRPWHCNFEIRAGRGRFHAHEI